MIPIEWKAVHVCHSKKCRNGFWLVAKETVAPHREGRRYYGHITIGHMGLDGLMLLMRDDAARIIEGFKNR